jgi:hypothetical protein
MDDLTRAGLLRERLNGEVILRPMPKKLLDPVFFGKRKSSLEIFKLGKEETYNVFRFHWSEDTVTQVQETGNQLILSQSGPEQLEALVAEQVRGTERPMRMGEIFDDSVTRILMIKRAVVGKESTCMILFEQFGGLYSMDNGDKPQAIPASQAREKILAELKGE